MTATPDLKCVPEIHRDRVQRLFDTWGRVSRRNRELSAYYEMKNPLRDLGISIPRSMQNVNAVVGWCKKAISARVVRSKFDGYVFRGRKNPELDALVRDNDLRAVYGQALQAALVHGVSAVTVMAGSAGQPAAKARVFSANQFSALWDYRLDRIDCGVVVEDVDEHGEPTRYCFFFPSSVAHLGKDGDNWTWTEEGQTLGRPMMELFVNERSADYPLGRSLITPELMGIVDKAMRDVLRMDIGAEFFTFPQRYVLGAADDLFAAPLDPDQPVDEDGTPIDENGDPIPRPQSEAEKLNAYIGSILALTRDENGDVPQVGQFSPADPSSFAAVFENDAQRFSGASLVPLGQLGVLSNTYTSSDALGAANDPLILEVERINSTMCKPMEEIGRMMLAVARGTSVGGLPAEDASMEAYFADPSMPTISARADAWTKLAAADQSLIGTRVYYEGVGMSQQTIDRIEAERRTAGALDTLNEVAQTIAGAAQAQNKPTVETDSSNG